MKTYMNWVKLQVAAATDRKGDESSYFAYDTYRPTAAQVKGFVTGMGEAEGKRMLRDVYQQTKVANRSAATSKSDKVSAEELQRTTLRLLEEAVASGKTIAQAVAHASANAAGVAAASHGTLASISKKQYLAICATEDVIIKEVFAGWDEATIADHLADFDPEA